MQTKQGNLGQNKLEYTVSEVWVVNVKCLPFDWQLKKVIRWIHPSSKGAMRRFHVSNCNGVYTCDVDLVVQN